MILRNALIINLLLKAIALITANLWDQVLFPERFTCRMSEIIDRLYVLESQSLLIETL